MEQILAKLSEWKEKILFVIVLIACVFVAMHARPLGGGIADIDAAEMDAAIKQSGIDAQQATYTLTRLQRPPEVPPSELDLAAINRPFFDERDVYTPAKASAWQLAQQEYKTLPPLELSSPGFQGMPDFDVPAGPLPGVSALRGYIPRDTRPVSISDINSSEFRD